MKGSFAFLVASLAGSAVASPSWRSLFGVEKRQAGRCGTGFGGVCGKNECCSSAGWCGTGYLYCSAPSCQIEYGPGCDANVRPTGPDTTNIARPKVGSIPYGQAIYRCSRNGDIALTYDDGPYTYTEDLLDLLKRYNARATFYITGRNLGKGAINDAATPWPGLIRRMIKDGHQIASHTWSHQRLTTLSRAKFWNQMIFNEIAFADILGYFPTYMRPPYSASNATTDAWLGELGYHVTYFNLDTEGYLHDSPNTISTSKAIWDSTVEGRSPSSNTWLHIEHDPVYQSVYNLTEYMLKSLTRNKFSAVTVGECLQDPKANWYRQRRSRPRPTAGAALDTAARRAEANQTARRAALRRDGAAPRTVTAGGAASRCSGRAAACRSRGFRSRRAARGDGAGPRSGAQSVLSPTRAARGRTGAAARAITVGRGVKAGLERALESGYGGLCKNEVGL
ncbi:Bifunctional xylanase deacetylase [Fusarium acuminatum]|uniref:Bifunctional xylanase deacetylase n=1 Tax=Fusarium acuminatum TaxID=5515 RepID=A0ABZ2X1H4_9HYPO